jgi:thiol-disulfide isomerase/thioredoxin
MCVRSIISFSIMFVFSLALSGQKTMPSATVSDKIGQDIDISSYVQDGGIKLVSLWATWCGPCRMELNALNKVKEKWASEYGVEIIAVTVDYPSMLNRAKMMFEKNDWDFTFMHDKGQELMSKLGIRGIPYSMLIDGNGHIQSVQMGYFPGYEKDLEIKIKKL